VTETTDRQESVTTAAADEELIRQLTERAQAEGLQLTGEGGLLGQLTKMVIEGALEGEMEAHLGYGRCIPGMPDGWPISRREGRSPPRP
jgi:putative transposase